MESEDDLDDRDNLNEYDELTIFYGHSNPTVLNIIFTSFGQSRCQTGLMNI